MFNGGSCNGAIFHPIDTKICMVLFHYSILRMYCIDTEALVFMFSGGSPYTNHINNKKHVHHGFLAPRPYLCSTSLRPLVTSSGECI